MDQKKAQFLYKLQKLRERLITVDGISIDPKDCNELETHFQYCLKNGEEMGKTLEIYSSIRHLTECGK